MNLKERNQSLKEFFDRKTVGYDDVHSKFMDSKRALTEALPEDTEKVLDLGAGTGLELIPLVERFPNVSITVADISEDMLNTLRERPFAGQVTYIVGDFFETDLGSGYDAMISTSALHHFAPEDKVCLYRKVYDALRSGGLFVNSDKTAPDPAAQEEGFRELAEDPHRWPHMDTPLTIGAECTILEQAGFRIREVRSMPNEGYFLYIAEKTE